MLKERKAIFERSIEYKKFDAKERKEKYIKNYRWEEKSLL